MYSLVKCLVFLSAALAAHSYNLNAQDVAFHLFTRSNPAVSQVLFPTPESIMFSNFNPAVRTIYTVHGEGDSFANFNAFIVLAHLEAEDVNVIAVDWRKGSGTYTEGLAQARQAGQLVADFINLITSPFFGVPISSFRIVGAGLGGHIAGIIARNSNGEIPHIVALDPSLFGWSHNPDRLSPSDAGIVEVIHTTAGLRGYDYPLGDIDFYPNGGSYQSGCGIDVSCSHIYSYAFYSESVNPGAEGRRFVGTACDSYEEAIHIQCSGERDAIFGGTEVKTSESGIYSFRTNFSPPFALD